MKPGDLVLAYGAKSVLGVGEITGSYFAVDGPHPHRRAVKWLTTKHRPITDLPDELQGRFQRPTTIFELSREEFELATHGIFSHEGTAESFTGAPTIGQLSAHTFMPVSQLQELEALLQAKKQIVLEGPPGSGKTFVADLLARYLTGNPLTGEHNEQIELVQFHQSYGYEDFIQGIRPLTDENGQISYRVLPGIFIQMCERAHANPDKPFVLIIDEINRGNISRIFGELMLLLEYRERKARLPYGPCKGAEDGHLSIPKNLLLIGTMNSTDRSLALIDYALRRRFYFYRLLPVVNGEAAVFASWLDRQDIDASTRAHRLELFIALNHELTRKNLPVDFQIGHSYFMTHDVGTQDGLDRIWQWGIKPLLLEYFHSAKNADSILLDFDVERLVPKLVIALDHGIDDLDTE